MIGRVLFVVDGSAPPGQATKAAQGLLPAAAEIVVLQVVPQLPHAWGAWPAFPDQAEDLANASAHVARVAHELAAQGWNVSSEVRLSVLSAVEMDREVLRVAEALRPDLICLAVAQGNGTATIVRKAAVPVLVAKPSPSCDDAEGRRVQAKHYPGAIHAPRAGLFHPAPALAFRGAGTV